ncbi:hypothetical protein ABWC92_004608 [Escherichia coli]|uniref:hypothetical protein n=1 Tax=Enterobacter sp. JMULE2 TaxID=2518340 RepID=UPI0015762A75|nr:hypothetical protein [Enterobacter sp. JMULE2]NTZ41091.1 hypothetical protein [Enterobacter sp. JMULE2]
MCAPDSQIVAIFSSRHENVEDAANAGELFSVDIEYPMTLNDLSRLCDSVASALGIPGGVKYGFINQPEAEEQV